MDLFSDLISAVKTDLNISSDTSSLYPLLTIKLALNRSYRKAGGFFAWPETEDAKKTSTKAGQEYYDYVKNWRPDSIWKLKVDGTDFGEPLLFPDYLYETENDFPNGQFNIWTTQARRFFIRVNKVAPTANGNNNICVWGLKVVDELVNDSDTTIFSYSMPECNDAVVQEAEAILKSKGEEEKRSEFRSAEAQKILTLAWKRVQLNQAKYQRTRSFFTVPDYFKQRRLRSKTRIGNFDF